MTRTLVVQPMARLVLVAAIALALSGAAVALAAMMRDHLDLTLAEAVARLEGRYADDAAAYDEIHAQILHMADMLSDGIVAQFPGQFGR